MLRWGILGTSFISETVAKAILADPGSSIQAVAGRRQSVIDTFAEEFAVPNKYNSYEELIQDPQVDIVYIGLPNHLHHTYILESVSANKHVLCEKSLSIDLEKSQLIVDAVTDSEVFFIEGLMYLHHPLMTKLVEVLQDNIIGDVRTVSGQYYADIAEFVNPDSKGAIYNLGCYPVSLLHLVLQTSYGSEVFDGLEITGFGSLSEKDGNICEASMQLRLPNGVVGLIHTAETFGMFSEFVVIGEKGSLRFVTNPWLPGELNTLELTSVDGERQQIEVTGDGDAFYYQIKNIRQAIEQGRRYIDRPAARLQDSFEVMSILSKWEASIVDYLEAN